MALTQVKAAGLTADAIDSSKLADNSIDSEHYADGSIDNAHIADDAIDSEHYVDGSIDTAHLADDAVTLAKMASGTDGQIITYDASGNPTAVGPGTDGQVLTSTGAGSPPAFEDAAGGGITSAVLFRKTASTQGNSLPITDWEKCDSNQATGVDVASWSDPSSGIFTFPSTGIWHISAVLAGEVDSTQSNNTTIYIYVTGDNSSYVNVAMNQQGGNTTSNTSAMVEYIVDVTNLTNVKCKISFGCHNGNEYVRGSDTRNETTVTFTRLGDT